MAASAAMSAAVCTAARALTSAPRSTATTPTIRMTPARASATRVAPPSSAAVRRSRELAGALPARAGVASGGRWAHSLVGRDRWGPGSRAATAVALTATGGTPKGRPTGSSTDARTRVAPSGATATRAARPSGSAARAAARARVRSPPTAASLAASRAAPCASTWSRASPSRLTMARATATRSGIAAASSTVADPESGASRPATERLRLSATTRSAHAEQRSDVVEHAGEQVGDGAVARSGQGE